MIIKYLYKIVLATILILLFLGAFTERSDACTVSDELYKVTEMVYFEARNLSFEGQLAVATVAVNRVYHKNYPDNLCDVVNQPKQFSYYSDGLPEVMEDLKSLETAREVANCIVKNECTLHSVREATHYYACKGFYKIAPPYWAKDFKLIAEVGDHCFYKS